MIITLYAGLALGLCAVSELLSWTGVTPSLCAAAWDLVKYGITGYP